MLTMDDDDDMPQLSTDTLKALQEFRLEQHEKELKLMEIMEQSNPVDISNLSFGEDWQLSQFWYSEETAISLAKAATAVVGYKGNIALISCPTLYKHIKSLAPDCKVSLLEYDNRFAITAGEAFVQYDYNFPLDVPRELASQCDLVVMDPPFLSEECLTKTSVTAKFLAKHKIVLCTGAVMEDFAMRLLDLKKCSFEPKHQNNLANKFYCFANFDLDSVLSNL